MSKPSNDDFGARSKLNRAPANLTQRGAERRDALLAAALRIIVKDGPGSVTFRTVVAEAKASHGSVAYYFGTREELIREAMVLVANRNIEALAKMLREFESTPIELASSGGRSLPRVAPRFARLGPSLRADYSYRAG